ncbi:hypothetical protein [Cohnella cholangitidis]|uniref:Uncharacterized protein n=1 Tax=Cohnella cholangitidis TaxID=2598458 RepID=A0A7G5BY12_9BACL|nr:hypothetical protein [Cohnella cholangitidis]QMV41846.1 hypothetical protein FPL14_12115 [Cohnella cholangitidis]
MTNNLKRDVTALVLIVIVLGIVFSANWVNATVKVGPVKSYMNIVDSTERLGTFLDNYTSLSPLQVITTDFNPQIYTDAAADAPDYGTANDLRYAAELITKFNDGAGVKTLQEAYDVLIQVIAHFRELPLTPPDL